MSPQNGFFLNNRLGGVGGVGLLATSLSLVLKVSLVGAHLEHPVSLALTKLRSLRRTSQRVKVLEQQGSLSLVI